jgi:hypothetical protein
VWSIGTAKTRRRTLSAPPRAAQVAVAGLYRTGKSFFLNQLCGAPGFKVDHDDTVTHL